MTETIRILIADDHTLVRTGLNLLIATEPEMEVVGEAADGVETVLKARTLQPDVILLDLVMPRLDGIGAIQEILRENPDIRILVLTSFAEDEKVFPAIKAGALGYLLKDAQPTELLRAIRDVYEGEMSLNPTIARKLLRDLRQPSAEPPAAEQLTERELEVLKMIAQGLSNREIADRLIITERTARTHVGNILHKLQVVNRTQAALYALRTGLASLDDTE